MTTRKENIVIPKEAYVIWGKLSAFEKYPEWRADASEIEMIDEKCFKESNREGYKTIFTIEKSVPLTCLKLCLENDSMTGYREFLLDSLGSAIAEAVVREVCSKVESHVLPLGYGVSHPYSPGYCGWHVTQQQLLFSLLPEQPCGVRLSESSLMSPIKSVSGVIAVGERIVKRKYGCELCGKIDCYKNRNKLKK